MIETLKNTIDNENGFVLIVALLMLAIITVIGIAATQTSDIEIRIDYEATTYIHTGCFIVYSIDFADHPTCI